MGVEVMVAYAPPGVSTCSSDCGANETVGFSVFSTPGLGAIKSMRLRLFAAMATAYFVAFFFLFFA